MNTYKITNQIKEIYKKIKMVKTQTHISRYIGLHHRGTSGGATDLQLTEKQVHYTGVIKMFIFP